ncbi:MAG: hypothetical protein IT293_11305 [Deltaproteobacteria bacterium]|nr:hypothetical protein [Deltaproteobacteria bacterium]
MQRRKRTQDPHRLGQQLDRAPRALGLGLAVCAGMEGPPDSQHATRKIDVLPLEARRLARPESRPEQEMHVAVERRMRQTADAARAGDRREAEALRRKPAADAPHVGQLERIGFRLLPGRPHEPHENITRHQVVDAGGADHRTERPVHDVADVLDRDRSRDGRSPLLLGPRARQQLPLEVVDILRPERRDGKISEQ